MAAFNSWNVVDNYNNVLSTNCQKITNDYFLNDLLKKSNIDKNANIELADQIHDLDKKIKKTTLEVNTARFWMIFLRIFGGILFIGGGVLIALAIMSSKIDITFLLGGIGGILVGITVFALSWILKKKKITFQNVLNELKNERNEKYEKAQKQLHDLYALMHDRMSFDIFEKTFNNVQFDNYLSDKSSKKWLPFIKDSNDISTIFCISGYVANNPFIVNRTRNTAMFMETYTGSLTVMVRRTRRVNGRTESYMAPKVIVAIAKNPAPRYWTETKLLYLSSIAKDLSFQNIKTFKSEHKANKFFIKNKSMSPMDNPEFDKLFPCERDNEIEFRSLWTPMAQEELIKLIKEKKYSFSYTKNKDLSCISSNVFNENDFYYFANRYFYNFDYRDIENEFNKFNVSFFNGIYWMLAPILTIPIFQQTRFYEINDKNGDEGYSSFFMESKVNLLPNKISLFHPESKTENILKVKRVSFKSGLETDQVIAYGYETKFRTVIVPVFDAEVGHSVPVPVIVIDYIPVYKETIIENNIKQSSSDIGRDKMNFAITSAILASSMPKEFVPNKDEILNIKKRKN